MLNLTLDEFNSLYLSIEKKAKALLRSKGEHALTMFIGNGSDVYLSSIPDGSTETLVDIASRVGQSIGAEYIVIVSEAWLSSDTSTAPSKAPDRQEVLFVSAEHVQYGQRVSPFLIKRNSAGKVVGFTPYNTNADFVGGRLSNLLAYGRGNGTPVALYKRPGYKSHYKQANAYTLH